jgi:hypothetical protein
MSAGSVKPNTERIKKDGCECIRYVLDINRMHISVHLYINAHASSCVHRVCA